MHNTELSSVLICTFYNEAVIQYMYFLDPKYIAMKIRWKYIIPYCISPQRWMREKLFCFLTSYFKQGSKFQRLDRNKSVYVNFQTIFLKY